MSRITKNVDFLEMVELSESGSRECQELSNFQELTTFAKLTDFLRIDHFGPRMTKFGKFDDFREFSI